MTTALLPCCPSPAGSAHFGCRSPIMLADFQPRCIMIFMAMRSENAVGHPYCSAVHNIRLPMCDSAGAGWAVRNRKGTSGIRVIGLSLPYFIREPAYYDGRGLTSLDAGAKGTHGKQDHGVTSRGTRCRHGARPTPMGDDWRRHRIKGGHPRQSRTTRRTSSPKKISTSVEDHVKREIRSCQMQV